ncbi:hypothetical protein TNCT_359501 [Trichonephila clavata]|uniref:Uncharacterized protein n=1 Tax=Trichonephila clavata TaxID=2740835 RepID=A0A8X6J5A9_TRICU|nr:hypothetical protein TNCT_214621 [Trichonephila clavata]GFR10718.1 hypothetical protein TNCT_359501 [Trichonephila clavata]
MHGLIFETSICYWQDQPGILPFRRTASGTVRTPPALHFGSPSTFYDVRKGTQSEAFASVDFERAVGHRKDQAGSVADQMRDSPKPPERPGEPSRETGCVPPKREIHGPGVPSTGPIRDGSPHRKQPPVRRARRN